MITINDPLADLLFRKCGLTQEQAVAVAKVLSEHRDPPSEPAASSSPAASGAELPTAGRRLYLDCDGVLADFDAAFLAKFGHLPRDYEDAHGAEVFWRDIKTESPTFYRDLPLMPDARELFEAVKHLRPIILTGCPRGGWAEMQKLEWAAEHFPGTPMIVCRARDKCIYLDPGDILIDDRTQYRDRWEKAGGVFIHHTSAADSVAALMKLRGSWHKATPPAELESLRAENERLTEELDEALKQVVRVEAMVGASQMTTAALRQQVERLREALSWSLDLLDMYDERLATFVEYETVNMAGKRKARAALSPAITTEPSNEQ